MERRTICRGLTAMPLLIASRVKAQTASVLRVAFVSSEPPNTDSTALKAFREGLRELDYIEGRNLALDAWWGEGSSEHIERIAGAIERSGPNVIVAAGGFALFPLIRAGTKLPIDPDDIGLGRLCGPGKPDVIWPGD